MIASDETIAAADVGKKRRKSSISPTRRTLAECRERGYVCQVVEHWNQYARVRVDLFGVIDIVAITVADHDEWTGEPLATHGRGMIRGIQACVGASHATRRTKILAEPRAKAWVFAGGVLEIWSWAKQGARGKRKTWTLRIERILAGDFAC